MATSNFARPSNASNYYVVLTNKEIEYKECSECGEIHNDWDFDLDKRLLCNSCGEELPDTETRYDAPEEWDIDYLKENVINAIEAKGGYSINKWANNYIELGCIEKSKVYGEVEVGVKVTAILQSAYYEGATLDFLVQVLLGGDFVLEREGYQTMVAYETPLNSWSSAYIVKKFNLNKPRSQKMFENLVEKLTDL